MKSPAPFLALSLALLVSACGSTGNTTSNTTNSTTNSNASASSNTTNTANTANTSNTSNTSTSESGSHPTDQIDTAAKVENGKTMTLQEDITLTLPADWKKDTASSNDNATWFTGKTKDGKPLTLVVSWMPAEKEYAGLSTPEAAMKYMKEAREYAEKDDRRTLPRILKITDGWMGVAQDLKSSSPDGFDEWTWYTWDSADFTKGFTFRYPSGTFDQHKSLRDGIINSVKFKRGPRMPSM